ncbi:hypothetical protein Tco_0933418 [Tanacetum coccineum]
MLCSKLLRHTISIKIKESRKTQEIKVTKTFQTSVIKDNSLETKLRDRLMQSMSMLVKTQDHRWQSEFKTNKDKDLKISDGLERSSKTMTKEFEDHTLGEIISLKYVCEHGSSESAGSLASRKIVGLMIMGNAKMRALKSMIASVERWSIYVVTSLGVLLARQACFHDNVKSFDDVGGGVLGPRTLHLDFDILLELLLSDKRSHHDGEKAFFI